MRINVLKGINLNLTTRFQNYIQNAYNVHYIFVINTNSYMKLLRYEIELF